MNRHRKLAGLISAAFVLSLGVARAAEHTTTTSVARLYDGANASARAGDVGRAVLGYERAQLLAPRDPDIAANLALTRTRAGLATPAVSRLRSLPMQLTSATWCFVALGGLWLACGAVALSSARWRRPLRTLAFVAASISVTAFGAVALRAMHDDEAVVVAKGSLGLSPFPDAATVGSLAAGQDVRVGARHGDYVRVTDDAGRAGWVLSSSVQRVVPVGS